MAREQSWLELCLLELVSIGCVLFGIFILFTDFKNLMLALASIIFFGITAIDFYAIMVAKRKQRSAD